MTQHNFTSVSGFVAPQDHRQLYENMRRRLDVGDVEQQRLIELVGKMVIRDRLAAPGDIRVHPDDFSGQMIIRYKGEDPCTIHQHALGQLAAKVNVPMSYVNALNKSSESNWKRELLGTILTTSFHKDTFNDRAGDPRFLHRIVGDELRGFLSRRFNRHLASAPLLNAFLEATKEHDAFPFDAITTDVKLALRCFLPYVFAPMDGQYVALGAQWSNSDFGSGRLQVALTMWMPQNDRFTVLDHTLARVHIGSIIEDSDMEVSEGTAKKEVEAQASAIHDTVRSQLSPESVEKVLKAIQLAHADAIPWHRLRGNLARFLGKGDIENLHELLNKGVEDLPPVKQVDGEVRATKWWASQALSWMASKELDPEKRLDLQSAAGSFIEVKA